MCTYPLKVAVYLLEFNDRGWEGRREEKLQETGH